VGGRQYVVALFADGFPYVLPENAIPGLPSRPARAGGVITLYGIGFGPVTPAVPPGQVAASTAPLATAFQLTMGGTNATVAYAGLAPNTVGLYQFNVVVPAVPAGSSFVPVAFTLGNAAARRVSVSP